MNAQPNPQLAELLIHQAWIRGLARRLIADEHAAEDLSQDAWVAALERPPQDRGTPRAWLGRVLRNRTIDRSRTDRNRATRERQRRPQNGPAPPDEVVARAEAHRVLVQTVFELDEPYRSTVLLRYFDDLSPTQIAARQGIPRETVRTRLKRALEQLRARLDTDHVRGRAEWLAALLPLTATGATASSTLPQGGIAMATGKKTALICVVCLLALGVLIVALGREDAPPEGDTGQTATAPPASSEAASQPNVPTKPTPVDESNSSAPAKKDLVPVAPPPQPSTEASGTQPEKAPTSKDNPPPVARSDSVIGHIRGPDGAPLEDALVYFGNQTDGRGDEPFKPFQERRIKNGVRTDAEGRFELKGSGAQVTIWHPQHSSITVDSIADLAVSLPARTTLRGVLLDAEGKPRVGVPITLDRASKTETDAEGRFEIKDVELGIRGLQIERSYLAVTVVSGQKNDLVIEPGLPSVRIELSGLPDDTSRRLMGALIGQGTQPRSFVALKGVGSSMDGANVLPGTYTLFVYPGIVSKVRIDGAKTELPLGKATLTIRGPARTRCYAIPAGSDPLVELMAGRMCRSVPDSGELVLEHLTPGLYSIGLDRKGVIGTVEVTAKGARFDL